MTEEKSEVFRSNAPQEIGINEGAETKRKKPVEGPTELRQVTDHHATGTAAERELIEVDIGKQLDEAVIEGHSDKVEVETEAATDVPAPAVEVAMIKKDDAIPWALSINLEERIKGLGSKTASVNQELDALEAASQKLAKRIGK